MFLRHILVISLLTVGNAALADSIDLNLRDSSAQLQYSASMGRDTLGKSELHLGVLYANKDNFLSDFGLLVKDEIGSNAPGVTVGVGIKAVAARVNALDASAVAIGVQVGFKPFPDPRFNIVGQVYASPTILTFGQAKRYIESTVRMEYEIIPQAVAYVGYRTTRFDFKTQPTATLDDGLNVGIRLIF